MQIVIDIDDDTYRYMQSRCKYQNKGDKGLSMFEKAGVAIKNGKILPKGHGRLGDLDAICKDVIESLCIKNETFLLEAEMAVYKRIKNASTIIEADKEAE